MTTILEDVRRSMQMYRIQKPDASPKNRFMAIRMRRQGRAIMTFSMFERHVAAICRLHGQELAELHIVNTEVILLLKEG